MAEANFETIYHGSLHIIEKPELRKGKTYNDYGQGFYTTSKKEMAGEWAVLSTGRDGFINEYTLNYTGLTVLDLEDYPLETWIAILMMNRSGNFSAVATQRIKQFITKFSIDLSRVDVIKGYRADDSFFSYVGDFATAGLSKENLNLKNHLLTYRL